MILEYTVKKSDENIKQILKNEFNMSERFILKLKRNNCIFVNDNCVSISFQLKENDALKIVENFEEDSSGIVPNKKIQLNILYEDEYLLIVDKPANIPVHPSVLHYEDSLSNGVKAYYDKINLRKKIRPVNRLDKDTSGIVVFAKNEYIQECLVKQMANGKFIKKYIALLENHLDEPNGTINAPISRKENSIIERCVDDSGDSAITHYKVLSEFNNLSEVEFTLETGRTHQIRVHSAYIGHPILGDSLYGKKSELIDRQALHAYFVSFIHPITKKEVTIISQLPDDIKNCMQ